MRAIGTTFKRLKSLELFIKFRLSRYSIAEELIKMKQMLTKWGFGGPQFEFRRPHHILQEFLESDEIFVRKAVVVLVAVS